MPNVLLASLQFICDSMTWMSNAAKHGIQAYPKSAEYGFLHYSGIIGCLKLMREPLLPTLFLRNLLLTT